ncbi:hypothetical protein Acr_14g0007320 [Actinidia rufa]|uniref:Uncharacterized protein n=1 Tax=Actinidia rufa TaxID=165716 RepID=A0A7J0FRR4_9ERIC|nr:hypothetical protein Acr_14g0007320 [Actinidia rufa]
MTVLNTLCTCANACCLDRVPAALSIYRASPMANTSQTSDLEGIHHEMHGIAKQIKIMNEINALPVQYLATNNPPLATAPILEEANRSCRSHRSGDQDSQNCHGAGEEGVLVYRSLGYLAELMIRWVRKPGDGKDHLARTTELTCAEINPLLRKLKTWMLGLTSSIQA